jgi:hypothetical protein
MSITGGGRGKTKGIAATAAAQPAGKKMKKKLLIA